MVLLQPVYWLCRPSNRWRMAGFGATALTAVITHITTGLITTDRITTQTTVRVGKIMSQIARTTVTATHRTQITDRICPTTTLERATV